MRRVLQSVAVLLLVCGCASPKASQTPQPYSQTAGPFAATYNAVTDDVVASLQSGRTDQLVALAENISAMVAFSQWAFYPTNNAFVSTSDQLFTTYIYTTYEADVTHWQRVILFGSSSEQQEAKETLRKRAQSLVNGYPFSAQRNRFEDVGFASIVGLMSRYILPELVPLVREAMPRWGRSRQTTGLCVLAHAGDAEADDKLKAIKLKEDQAIVNIYRTSSHWGKNSQTIR